MTDQSEDVELVNRITALVRDSDQAFERAGGSSRHWVRDCFLPTLNKVGLVVESAARERAQTCSTCRHVSPLGLLSCLVGVSRKSDLLTTQFGCNLWEPQPPAAGGERTP